jgi:hypothetical protein
MKIVVCIYKKARSTYCNHRLVLAELNKMVLYLEGHQAYTKNPWRISLKREKIHNYTA